LPVAHQAARDELQQFAEVEEAEPLLGNHSPLAQVAGLQGGWPKDHLDRRTLVPLDTKAVGQLPKPIATGGGVHGCSSSCAARMARLYHFRRRRRQPGRRQNWHIATLPRATTGPVSSASGSAIGERR